MKMLVNATDVRSRIVRNLGVSSTLTLTFPIFSIHLR